MLVNVMMVLDMQELAQYIQRTGLVPEAIICGENATGLKVYSQVPVECRGAGNEVEIKMEDVGVVYERTIIHMNDVVVYVYQLLHVVRDPIKLKQIKSNEAN